MSVPQTLYECGQSRLCSSRDIGIAYPCLCKRRGRKETIMNCSSGVDLTDLVQFLLDDLDSLSNCLFGNG